MKKRAMLLLMACLFFPSSLWAWNAAGHRVIAEIAWQNLVPAARQQASELVDIFSEEYPAIHLFMQMAPWPDQLRGQKIEYYTHWHYIDLAFSADNTPLKNLTDTDNAGWAMEKLLPVLENPNANPYEKARAMAFVIHITGDLHQPLHTVSRISKKSPNGDQGGNLFFLTRNPANRLENLHHLWDTGLGVFVQLSSPKDIQKMAKKIMKSWPKKYFGNEAKNTDPQKWIQEGYKTARTFVYNTPENNTPDAHYLAEGQQVSEMKAALAGYRLAALLNAALK